jgi:hydrogenase maturation protease
VKSPKILVLGVGNALMSDEGVGVHCIDRLEAFYCFSENVRLFDGGTLGMRLLGPISEAAFLIVVDTALQGFEPGVISKLSVEDIRARSTEKHSMHELSFSETLFIAEAMGYLPPTTIIAIEPLDIVTFSAVLTPPLAEKLEDLCHRVLDEIKKAGGAFTLKKPEPQSWSFNLQSPSAH